MANVRFSGVFGCSNGCSKLSHIMSVWGMAVLVAWVDCLELQTGKALCSCD